MNLVIGVNYFFESFHIWLNIFHSIKRKLYHKKEACILQYCISLF